MKRCTYRLFEKLFAAKWLKLTLSLLIFTVFVFVQSDICKALNDVLAGSEDNEYRLNFRNISTKFNITLEQLKLEVNNPVYLQNSSGAWTQLMILTRFPDNTDVLLPGGQKVFNVIFKVSADSTASKSLITCKFVATSGDEFNCDQEFDIVYQLFASPKNIDGAFTNIVFNTILHGNSDLTVNPGEVVTFNLTVQNVGTSAFMQPVTASIVSVQGIKYNEPLKPLLNTDVQFGSLGNFTYNGQTISSNDKVQLLVASNAAGEVIVRFKLNDGRARAITDTSGVNQIFELHIPVSGMDITPPYASSAGLKLTGSAPSDPLPEILRDGNIIDFSVDVLDGSTNLTSYMELFKAADASASEVSVKNNLANLGRNYEADHYGDKFTLTSYTIPKTFNGSPVYDGKYKVKVRADQHGGGVDPNFVAGEFMEVDIDTQDPIAELTGFELAGALSGTPVIKNANGVVILTDSVNILGTAKDRYIKDYKFSIAAQGSSTYFDLPGVPVYTENIENEALSAWDTSTITDLLGQNVPREGLYTLKVTVTDRVGHVSMDTIPVYIDNEPPDPEILVPYAGEFIAGPGDFDFSGQITETNLSYYGVHYAEGINPDESVLDTGLLKENTYPTPENATNDANTNNGIASLTSSVALGEKMYRAFTVRLTARDAYQETKVYRTFSVGDVTVTINIKPIEKNYVEYNIDEAARIRVDLHCAVDGNSEKAGTIQAQSGRLSQGDYSFIWNGKGGTCAVGEQYCFRIYAISDSDKETHKDGCFDTLDPVAIPELTDAGLTKDEVTFKCKSGNTACNLNQYNVSIFKQVGTEDDDDVLVRTLSTNNCSGNSGQFTCTWSGLNDRGKEIETGTYYTNIVVTTNDSMKASVTTPTANLAGLDIALDVDPTNKRTDLIIGPQGAETWPADSSIIISKDVAPDPSGTEFADINAALKDVADPNGAAQSSGIAGFEQFIIIAHNPADEPGKEFQWDGRDWNPDTNSIEIRENGTYRFKSQRTGGSNPWYSFENDLRQDVKPIVFDDSAGFYSGYLVLRQADPDNGDYIKQFSIVTYDPFGNVLNRNDDNTIEDAHGLNGQEFPEKKYVDIHKQIASTEEITMPGRYTFQVLANDVAGNKSAPQWAEYIHSGPPDENYGADIWSVDKKARLTISAEALTGVTNTNFNVANLGTGNYPGIGSGFKFIGNTYDYEPDNTHFAKPVMLRLYYQVTSDGKVVAPDGSILDINEDKIMIYAFSERDEDGDGVGDYEMLGGTRGVELRINEWNEETNQYGVEYHYLLVYVDHLSVYALSYPTDLIMPVAEISIPTEGMTINGGMTIIGTAADDNFIKYELLVGIGAEPTVWHVIAEGTDGPVLNNELGHIDGKNYEGEFVLSLIVTDHSGNVGRDDAHLIGNRDVKHPEVHIISVSDDVISPNKDGRADTTEITFNISEECHVAIYAYNSEGTRVRTIVMHDFLAPGTYTRVWDESTAYYPLIDGTYSVVVMAIDDANNRSYVQYPITIDTQKPSFTNCTPENDMFTGNPRPVIQCRMNDTAAGIYPDSIVFNVDGLENSDYFYDSISGMLTWQPALALNDGIHSWGIQVRDTVWNQAVIDASFTVDNTPPDISITFNPVIQENDTAEFTSIINVEAGSGVASIQWDLDGDGVFEAQGQKVTRKYLDDGVYQVSLKVTDAIGNKSVVTENLTVENIAPTADAGSDITIQYGDTVHFEGSFNDPGTLDYHFVSWDFGDGSAPISSVSADHRYSVNPGEYTAVFSVRDDNGGFDNDSIAVIVEKEDTQITYEGDFASTYSNTMTLRARLTESEDTAESISGKRITWHLGMQSVSEYTDENGYAEKTLVVAQPAGEYSLNVVFDGDVIYHPASVSVPIIISKESLTLMLDSNPVEQELWAANDGVLSDLETVGVELTDDNASKFFPLGKHQALPIKLTLGAIDVPTLPSTLITGISDVDYRLPFVQPGDHIMTLRFPGNAYYNPVESHFNIAITDTTPPQIAQLLDAPDFFAPQGVDEMRINTIRVDALEINEYSVHVTVTCSTGSTECLSIYGSIPIFEQNKEVEITGSLQPVTTVFAWNGKDSNRVFVPEGEYDYTVVVTDNAGLGVQEQGEITVDNPPTIVAVTPIAYLSPNSDGNKDLALIKWSADQEGYFTFTVYDGNNVVDVAQTDVDTIGRAGEVITTTWDGLDNSGNRFDEGNYTIKITGRDAHSPTENPCVPASLEAVLDVTQPEIFPFYPLGDEFTWLKPKLKVDVSDNLSGFGADAGEMASHVTFGIAPEGLTLNSVVDASAAGQNAFRVVARPDNELQQGPHFLTIAAEDLAGNSAGAGPIRFVVIPQFEDDFEQPGDVDASRWGIVKVFHGKTLPEPDIQVAGGKLSILHEHTQADDGVLPQDMYGVIMHGKGVYDVSRQEVIIGADNVTESGYDGTIHAFGIMVSEADETQFPKRLYMLRSGDTILAFYENVPVDEQAWIAAYQLSPDSGAVDLKIRYEEGVARFYVNDNLIREVGIQFHYAMTGLVALSGFDGARASRSKVEGGMSSFYTILARPVVSQTGLANNQRPDASDIVYQSESYTLTAHGTPWQTQLQGRIYNPDRVGQVGNVQVALDKLAIGDAVTLNETVVGTGEYESAPIPFTIRADAQGNTATHIAPFAANEWFDIIPIEASNYATNIEDILSVIDFHAALKNADRPDDDNIMVGETVTVTATGSVGQNLEGYLVNPDNMSAPAAGYIIGVKFTLTDNGDGTYTANIPLTTNTDKSGATVNTVGALVMPVGVPNKARQASPTLRLQLRVRIAGEPIPPIVIRYQEPFFNYEIENLSGIALQGTVTGIVVSSNYQIGQPIHATFTDNIDSLQPGATRKRTARFTPVGPEPGAYKILIYFQPSGATTKERSLISDIFVEVCE